MPKKGFLIYQLSTGPRLVVILLNARAQVNHTILRSLSQHSLFPHIYFYYCSSQINGGKHLIISQPFNLISFVDFWLNMRSKDKISYFYDGMFFKTLTLRNLCRIDWVDERISAGDVGSVYFGPNHPMKPHRLCMTHHLVLSYDLHNKMEIYECANFNFLLLFFF